MSRWVLLFTVVPAVELYLLLTLGGAIGAGPTVALILITGVVGATLARREGAGVLLALQQDLAKGLPPATRLVEGALVFAGALLLLTPGVLTDAAGLALLLPPVRRAVAPALLRQVSSWGAQHQTSVRFGRVDATGASVFTEDAPPTGGARPSPFDHPVP